MTAARFVLKRLALGVGLLVLVSFLLFSLLSLAPGSQLSTLLGGQPATPDRVASLTTQYHLDDPFLAQYGYWLQGVLHGDFGRSVVSGSPAMARVQEFLPLTAQLAGATLLVVVVLGVPLGMAAGIRRGKALDRAVSVGTVVGMAAPPFAIGILLIYVFGVALGALPTYGAGQGSAGDRLQHLLLPVATLTFSLMALVVRQTRAASLSVMSQDFVTFARARGVAGHRILLQYALRNSALPIISAIGVLIIQLATGAILVESVFSLPGVGTLMVDSVQKRDVPVIQTLGLVIALVVVLSTLLVDVLSVVVDPRTRSSVRS